MIFTSRERVFGAVFRRIHSNGVSVFFLSMFFHVFRGVAYGRFFFFPVWTSGVVIFLFSVLVGFLGYSLPWAQIRFWAASVITSLRTAFPVFGGGLAELV